MQRGRIAAAARRACDVGMTTGQPANADGIVAARSQIQLCETGMLIGELAGQGWLQLSELGLAFALSALIGLEREIRHKSAGLRTYTLVGFSAALIMLVSKYGFDNILVNYRVVLDPSRIAAQIVTGIGRDRGAFPCCAGFSVRRRAPSQIAMDAFASAAVL